MSEQNNVQDQSPRRGRPARQENEQVQRRRRGDSGPLAGLKLYVPEALKDPNFEYRFVNDRPGRVQQLTQNDDYDVVPTFSAEGGGNETRVADKSSGERAVLLRKPKEFYESDKREEQKVLDERDEMLRRGAAPNAEGLNGSDNAYVPAGRNVVGGKR